MPHLAGSRMATPGLPCQPSNREPGQKCEGPGAGRQLWVSAGDHRALVGRVSRPLPAGRRVVGTVWSGPGAGQGNRCPVRERAPPRAAPAAGRRGGGRPGAGRPPGRRPCQLVGEQQRAACFRPQLPEPPRGRLLATLGHAGLPGPRRQSPRTRPVALALALPPGTSRHPARREPAERTRAGNACSATGVKGKPWTS